MEIDLFVETDRPTIAYIRRFIRSLGNRSINEERELKEQFLFSVSISTRSAQPHQVASNADEGIGRIHSEQTRALRRSDLL